MRRGWTNVCTDLQSAVTTWHAINANDLVAFNAVTDPRHRLAIIALARAFAAWQDEPSPAAATKPGADPEHRE